MRVFISWSGTRSLALAGLLHEWIPTVIQSAVPWMSGEDIVAGQRWLTEIGQGLQNSDFGILCVTRENQLAPWLNFEAGALARSMESGLVIPAVLDMAPADLSPGPLTQFQGVSMDEDGAWRLVTSMNSASAEPLPEATLHTVFRRSWPEFQESLAAIPAQDEDVVLPTRTDSQKLDEVLELVRIMSRASMPGSDVSRSPVARLVVPGEEILPDRTTAGWRNLVRHASNTLRAFLKPADVRVDEDDKKIFLRYGETHRFHYGQLRDRTEELAALVAEYMGPEYGFEVWFVGEQDQAEN